MKGVYSERGDVRVEAYIVYDPVNGPGPSKIDTKGSSKKGLLPKARAGVVVVRRGASMPQWFPCDPMV